jgi:hypothetical protein
MKGYSVTYSINNRENTYKTKTFLEAIIALFSWANNVTITFVRVYCNAILVDSRIEDSKSTGFRYSLVRNKYES